MRPRFHSFFCLSDPFFFHPVRVRVSMGYRVLRCPMDKEDITMRACGEGDLAFVYCLSKENMEEYVERHWGGWDDSLFWKDIEPEHITIVETGAARVGFFLDRVVGNVMKLSIIQVVPEHQGRGIGSRMLVRVEEEAKGAGCALVRLRVFADNPAGRFYEKHGYAAVEGSGSEIVMEKRIGD